MEATQGQPKDFFSGYHNPLAHLLDELRRLRRLNRLIAVQVLRLRQVNFYSTPKDFCNFFIDDCEVDKLLLVNAFDTDGAIDDAQLNAAADEFRIQVRKMRVGKRAPLRQYTYTAVAKSIEATSKTLMKTLKGLKGVFASPQAPEIGDSKSLLGMLARQGFASGRVDLFARVSEKLKGLRIKLSFTHALKFMSPEFKLLVPTRLENPFLHAVKPIVPLFGADSPQAVRPLCYRCSMALSQWRSS